MPKPSDTIGKTIHPLYNYPVESFAVFFIIVILVFATQYFQGELNQCLTPTLWAFGLLNLITPLIASYLYKTFSSLQATVSTLADTNQKSWFSQQETTIFGVNAGSIFTTICLALGGGIINYFMVGCVWTGIAKFFYFLHVVLLFGSLGILGWSYWGILLFSYRLRTIRLNSEPFETKKDEFETIGIALLGMFFAGVLLYIGALTATWISPLIYFFEVLMVQYVIFPVAIVLVCFFLFMQHFLHELMERNKRVRVEKILLFTKKHYVKWKKSQLPAHRTAINDLLVWKEKVEKEKDHPFDLLIIVFALATIFLPPIALFLPAIKTILQSF
ncbi:MAG: hypothetical protein QM730_17440 [Anaerolineales bacterium]